MSRAQARPHMSRARVHIASAIFLIILSFTLYLGTSSVMDIGSTDIARLASSVRESFLTPTNLTQEVQDVITELPSNNTAIDPQTPRTATYIPHTPRPHDRAGNQILILQYTYDGYLVHEDAVPYADIIRASLDGHMKYARAWGYEYRHDTGLWLAEASGMSHFLNKIYCLVGALLDNLGRGSDGADWILFADADALIYDPTVPVHALLPSLDSQLDPIILASQDENGLNAGIMMFRVDPELVAFLFRMISYENTMFIGGGKHPTDQALFGAFLSLEQNRHIRERYADLPRRWFNAYWPDRHVSAEVGEDQWWGSDNMDDPLDSQGPKLHVHIAGALKKGDYGTRWRETVVPHAEKLFAEGYLQSGGVAIGSVDEDYTLLGAGLWRIWEASGWESIIQDWWSRASLGTEGVKFNEY